MRIYEGSPRQDYEEALRSIGAVIDQRGMREITFNEIDDGFLVQGLALVPGEDRPWADPATRMEKESVLLREDDVARLIEEGVSRRAGRGEPQPGAAAGITEAGFYERALRVLGSYVDQQQPRDVFFFEQEQQFVMRLLMVTRAGLRHVLVEFTRDEIESMIAAAQETREG